MTLEEQVRQAVARGWCDPRNAHKEMDVDLADAISEEVVKSFSPKPDFRTTTRTREGIWPTNARTAAAR
jgi:hypothetical protein